MSNFSQSGNETSHVWINGSSSHSHLMLKSHPLSTKKPYGLLCAWTQKLFSLLAKKFISVWMLHFLDVAMKQLWESFYNMVKSHQISSLQSNKVLVHRAIVDWCIPDRISSPPTMEAIAKTYTNGDKHGLSRHRHPSSTYARAFSLFPSARSLIGSSLKMEDVLIPSKGTQTIDSFALLYYDCSASWVSQTLKFA